VDFHKPFADIYEIESRKIIFTGYEYNNLMYVKFLHENESEMNPPDVQVQVATVQRTQDRNTRLAELYHFRSGNLSAKYLRALTENVENIPPIKINDKMFRDCPICLQAKSTHLPHD